MGLSRTSIEWTDKSWTVIDGCAWRSKGCDNCYAATMANRTWGDRPFSAVRCHEDRLTQPLAIPGKCTWFLTSMGDVWHEMVPFDFVLKIFDIMAKCHFRRPEARFILLTKREDRQQRDISTIAELHQQRSPKLSDALLDAPFPLPNLALGVSVEHKQTVKRIEILRNTIASHRVVSAEPLIGRLGAVNLAGIDCVIVGGESGAKARPMHPEWVQEILDQCNAQKVGFFFKQWGVYSPNADTGSSCKTKACCLTIDGQKTDCHPKNDCGSESVKLFKQKTKKFNNYDLFKGVKHDDPPFKLIHPPKD
jgi:protein gp37